MDAQEISKVRSLARVALRTSALVRYCDENGIVHPDRVIVDIHARGMLTMAVDTSMQRIAGSAQGAYFSELRWLTVTLPGY